MNVLVSAKSREITAWRAAEDFAVMFRRMTLERAVAGRSGSAEAVYAHALATIKNAAETHRSLLSQMAALRESIQQPTSALSPRQITAEHYTALYHHFVLFQSAPAFYQKSMDYVRALSDGVMRRAAEQLGLFARHLPAMALVALGPAGRCEYSPYCQLQLLLVHADVPAAQRETVKLFCHTLHAEFEASGLAIDPVITPRSPEWRGSIADWRQRIEDSLDASPAVDLINSLRLTDQYPLSPEPELAQQFKELSTAILNANHPAQAYLVERMETLSHGLGIMGRLKLETGGPERGKFRLLDYGLLPFSSVLSVLALFRNISAVSSDTRIRALLNQGVIDVDLTEKMFKTWHHLHELRLRCESSDGTGNYSAQAPLLQPDTLSDEERHALKTTLAAVAAIQRHVAITLRDGGVDL